MKKRRIGAVFMLVNIRCRSALDRDAFIQTLRLRPIHRSRRQARSYGYALEIQAHRQIHALLRDVIILAPVVTCAQGQVRSQFLTEA